MKVYLQMAIIVLLTVSLVQSYRVAAYKDERNVALGELREARDSERICGLGWREANERSAKWESRHQILEDDLKLYRRCVRSAIDLDAAILCEP